MLSALHVAGEPGDRVQFSEFIIANVRLYALRNDFPLSTPAVANFTRCELAEALRKVRARLLACEQVREHCRQCRREVFHCKNESRAHTCSQ